MSESTFDLEGLLTPPEDKDWLHAWCKEFLDIDFPNQTISRFSDSNPMDFLWKVYSAMREGRSGSFMGLAGRDGSKTLALSALDISAMIHDQRDVIHVAMTTKQASRARGYLEKHVARNHPVRMAVTRQNTTDLRLMIDGEEVGMELLPAKPKSVQGAHGSLLTFDELASSMEPDNVRAVKDAKGIVSRSKLGKSAIVAKITSRQAGYSLAEKEIREREKSKITILTWTTLDCTQRCEDDRSGTITTPMWVNHMIGEGYTEQEFSTLSDSKREGFVRTEDTFNKCRECPLVSICCGDLKKQKSTSPVLRSIDDVILKIREAGSWDWTLAQIMSLKPSSEGLIYFEYDPRVHCPGWDRMWQVLTGKKPEASVDRDAFIKELKRRKCTFYAGIDWGWSSPSTCVVLAVDDRDNVFVIESMGRTYTNDPAFIELIKQNIHDKYDVQMYCADTENGSGIDLLRGAWLPVPEKLDKSIGLGINIVKGFLKVPGTNGQTKLFFAPDLKSQIEGVEGIMEELELYHKQTDTTGKILDDADPADEYDHYCDALRYTMVWLFGKSKMRVGTDPEQKKANPKSNIPSLEEIANQHGIQYNDNRELQDKPEPEDPDGGGPKGGGLQFSWT